MAAVVDRGPYELQIEDGPDLIGLLGDIDLDPPLLPGDKGSIPFTIQNIGDPVIDKKARIRISAYASLDQNADVGTDILIGELLQRPIPLDSDDVKSYKLKLVLPPTPGPTSGHEAFCQIAFFFRMRGMRPNPSPRQRGPYRK